MPNWNEVLQEVSASPLDNARRKYLSKLHQKTGRNIIGYYSGWLQKPNALAASINDDDKNGLMAAVHGLDRSLGLDLILHTPGGDLAATESIVDYLRKMFGTDIRAFVPQIAMSAGTMIACAAKEIWMGKQSNIGPIDPQFRGIPAHGVIEEFSRAIEETKANPASIPIWQVIVGKYHPTFLAECEQAISLASDMVMEWLVTGMFAESPDAKEKAEGVVRELNNHKDTKTHSRHIHMETAEKIGLVIKSIEEDQDFQDVILTVHHAYMHTLGNSNAIKIIENHQGNAIIQNIGP